MPARLKGQEVEIRIVRGGSVEESLTDVVSFEFAPKMEIKAQGYLGETSDRHDDVYSGCAGKVVLHLESGKAMVFVRDLVERARRRLPDFKVNILASVAFPGGEFKRALFSDVKFGAPPMSFNARADYVTLTLEWACDDYKLMD